MGSKCSILNDTKYNVWITHGINWPSLTASVTFLLSLATVGVGVVNKSAGGAVVVFDGFIGNLLLAGADEDKRKKTNRASATLIKPGEKYTWSGTLSLHMRVYVMNADDLQYDERVCFTGPTADSENVYSLSQDFEKLALNSSKKNT